jgi:hypothetical protein
MCVREPTKPEQARRARESADQVVKRAAALIRKNEQILRKTRRLLLLAEALRDAKNR